MITNKEKEEILREMDELLKKIGRPLAHYFTPIGLDNAELHVPNLKEEPAKARELKVGKIKRAKQKNAREILAKLREYYHPPSNTIIIDKIEFDEIVKAYGVEV